MVSSISVNDNVWHHITLVHHANQTVDLYVDATAQVTGASSTTTDKFPYKIDAFMAYTGVGDYTSGKLDDVRIYDNTLSGVEVKSLFDNAPDPAHGRAMSARRSFSVGGGGSEEREHHLRAPPFQAVLEPALL